MPTQETKTRTKEEIIKEYIDFVKVDMTSDDPNDKEKLDLLIKIRTEVLKNNFVELAENYAQAKFDAALPKIKPKQIGVMIVKMFDGQETKLDLETNYDAGHNECLQTIVKNWNEQSQG